MKFYPILLLVFLFGCSNENTAPLSHTANGTVIEVSKFSQVVSNLDAEIQIQVNADSPASCILQCDKSAEEHIIFNVEHDKLLIGTKPGFSFSHNQPILIFIRMKTLKSISCNGSGKMLVEGSAHTDQFDIENHGSAQIKVNKLSTSQLNIQGSGSGEIIVQGCCNNLKGSILGTGSIQAFALQAENTEVTLTGSGNLETTVSKSLDVNITGSGSVVYDGTPSVKKNINGSGTVRSK